MQMEIRNLRMALNSLELEFAAVAAEYEATDDWEKDGHVSLVSWLRHECHMTAHAAAGSRAVGQNQADLTKSIEAMNKGEIGFAHLALMATTANEVKASPTAEPFKEDDLLTLAKNHMVNRFRKDCAHVRHAVDERAFLAEQLQDASHRWLELLPYEGGALSIRGFFDAVSGATVRSALEPLARRNGTGDARELEKRMADALVEIAEHSLDKGLVPQHGGQRPHVQVTVPIETLQRKPGAPAAEMDFAGPVAAVSAQRLACDASISRVVLDSKSEVFEIGRSRRLPSAAMRRALLARDKGCVWPRCDRAATWTAAHHVVHWANGGATDLSNLVLLCRRHHWMVHEGGWELTRSKNGEIAALPPIIRYLPSWARAPSDIVAV
jgi:hypothetical protein